MKLIHTSDWHIGQSFYNYSRDEDHRCFCRQLCRLVADSKPDVLVVSGDVFDVAVPSIAAQKLLVEMLTAIHQAFMPMKIVIISGNHDSASRLGIHSPLWDLFNVVIVASPELVDGKLDCDRQIVEIDGKGFIVAAPFVSEFNYRRLAGDDTSDAMTAYHQLLLDRVAERNRNNLPVVLVAHLAVSGADAKGQNVARFSFCPTESLGEGYDYVALGHIHHPMTLSGGTVRYSGSPLPMSFDENYTHSVTVVEIREHGAVPVISTVPVEQNVDVLTVPEVAVPLDEVIAEIGKLPSDAGDYLRVNILVEGHLPGNARYLVEKALEGKSYRFCTLNPIRKKEPYQRASVMMTTHELKDIEPVDIARRYYELKYGCGLPPVMEKCVAVALENVLNNEGR